MENLIEELTKVNPSNLSEEGLKLFNKINEIIDKNQELEERNIYLVNERKKLEELLFMSDENYIEKSLIKEKIEELKQYKVNLLKKDYAKKQIELPNQNVLVCNAIRDIATTGKIQVLEELLREEK